MRHRRGKAAGRKPPADRPFATPYAVPRRPGRDDARPLHEPSMQALVPRRLMRDARTLVAVVRLIAFGALAIGAAISAAVAAPELAREAAPLTPDAATLRLVVARLPATIELIVAALALAGSIGVAVGFAAGLTPGSRLDRWTATTAIVGLAVPTFWAGLMSILVFSVVLGWLPPLGRGATATVLGVASSLFTLDGLHHLLAPAATLALVPAAGIAARVRRATAEAQALDFVGFARAKGVSEARIAFAHVGRYVAGRIVAIIGAQFGTLVALAVVVEAVFAWPGTGLLLLDAIADSDAPGIVAYLVVTVPILVATWLVGCALAARLDPRTRRAAHPVSGAKLQGLAVGTATTSPPMQGPRRPPPPRAAAALLAAAILAMLVVAVLLASWIAPLDVSDTGMRRLVGAVLSGLRTSFLVALASATLAFAVGTPLGLLAGSIHPAAAAPIVGLVGTQRLLPPLLVALVLVAVFGHGIAAVVLALAAAQWVHFAHAAHAAARSAQHDRYVDAARNLGLSPTRIALRHVLPNVLPTLVTLAAIAAARSIVFEATLSFLGVGLPADVPSLGFVIAKAMPAIAQGQYAASIVPGVAIVVAASCFRLVADRPRAA